jgi:hypothetical protein
MARERWAAFSVKDHKDAAALVADVLLYDRLILPYPEDDEERAVWESEERQWDPALLDRRLEALGELAEPVPWNERKRRQFKDELSAVRSKKALEQVKLDVSDMHDEIQKALPYQLTRRMLKQGAARPSFAGAQPVVVAAYRSWADLRADYLLEPGPSSTEAALALLVGRRFAVPADDRDPEAVLVDAIALAKQSDFKKKRRALFEWEDQVFAGRQPLSPEEALEELTAKAEDYNDYVRRAAKRVRVKLAFTVGSAALATVGSLLTGNPLPLAGATLSLVQFATLDRLPAIEARDAAAAAMLHDVHEVLRA